MTICQPDGTSLRSMLKIFKLREQYSLLHLCWLNHIHGYLWIWKHRQMTNGFFQYFRTNAFPTQRPKFWVDLQDPFPTNLRHKGGHFSLLPTYLYQMENGIGDTMNTVRRLNSNMECFAATVLSLVYSRTPFQPKIISVLNFNGYDDWANALKKIKLKWDWPKQLDLLSKGSLLRIWRVFGG